MPELRQTLLATRSYQRPMRAARRAGCKRFLDLWHRRSGKDRNGATFIIEEAALLPGVYYHLFPSLVQARADFWDNRIEDPPGSGQFVNLRDACFPEWVRSGKIDDKEMSIPLLGGGIYQMRGADDIHAVNRLRGPNPIGLLISEYDHGPLMKMAWDTLSPVLAENGGWAAFVYTPGEFDGKRLYEMALTNEFSLSNLLGWFVQKLTVADTRRDAQGESGLPVVSEEAIEAERREGKREAWIQREYYCSFEGATEDSIYGDLMQRAEDELRIKDIPFIANMPVGVVMDLGRKDAQAMWYYQVVGHAINFINYEEGERKDMRWCAQKMREKPYIYGRVVLPWDARGAEEFLTEVGFPNVVVNERTASLSNSIDSTRRLFSQFYFDKNKCARGIACLRYYRHEPDTRDVDPSGRIGFKDKPRHDWASHGADALRTGVEGGFEPLIFPGSNMFAEPIKVVTAFDPLAVGFDPRLLRV